MKVSVHPMQQLRDGAYDIDTEHLGLLNGDDDENGVETRIN